MLHAVDPGYIPAEEAWRRLSFAWETKTAVYIYGVTGYGKTRMVREFTKDKDALLISACEGNAEALLGELLQTEALPACVMIDDLQDSGIGLRELIADLVRRTDVWTVLVGRMPPQQWIFSFMAEGRMLVIAEKDLLLTGKEIRKMAELEKLPLSDETAEKISKRHLGNAYAVSAILRMMKSGYAFNEDLSRIMDRAYEQHLVENIISRWSADLQEFLLQVSVVDAFTVPLAVMITGDDQAAAIIRTAAGRGNFLTVDEDTYTLRPQLIGALRSRALQVYGLKKYRQLQNNAGLFYETRGRIPDALEIYRKSENSDGIRSILVRNARRHPGTGNYYELKDYYLALTEEEVRDSIPLMTALCMLHSILMDREKSEYWYGKLKDYAGRAQGREKTEADSQLVWLDIALPHRKSADIIDILTVLPPVLKDETFTFRDFSLTNNQPGLMNGDKDFCSWSRDDEALAETLGGRLEKLLGDQGKGLVHTALAESFYEKGRPAYDVLSHLTQARLEIESGGRDELLFAVTGIQVRMNLLMGNARYSAELLSGYEKRLLEKTENPVHPILKNLAALRCRMQLLAADTEAACRWLSEAPDETFEFLALERYRYLVKARVLLALGKNSEAAGLLHLVRNYAEWGSRDYLLMETGLLLSIALYREKGDWRSLFADTLKKASGCGFVRIISEEGAAVLPLLRKARKDWADSSWYETVLSEAEQMASHYPGYLNATPQKTEFSENGLRILKLQAEGKNTREIAEILGISERTVKYHAAENYRKLGARGKTDAVQTARSLNLL